MPASRLFGAAAIAAAVLVPACVLIDRVGHLRPRETREWSERAERLSLAGERNDDVRMLFSALAAADRALRASPTDADALFWRALTLDRLGLATYATDAYRQYLKVDRSSGRAVTALRRIRVQRARSDQYVLSAFRNELPSLESAVFSGDEKRVRELVARYPEQLRTYGETETLAYWARGVRIDDAVYASRRLAVARAIGGALAATSGERLLLDAVDAIAAAAKQGNLAHIQALAEAHELYAKANAPWPRAGHLGSLDRAAQLFGRTGSPMRWNVDIRRAHAQTWFLPAEGCKAIGRLLEQVPSSYLASHGQLQRLQGSCAATVCDDKAASQAYGRAGAIFKTLNERSNLDTVTNAHVHMLRTSRDYKAIWRLRRDTFSSTASFKQSWAIEWPLMEVAHDSVEEEEWDIVRTSTNLLVDSQSALMRVESRLLRGFSAETERPARSEGRSR